MDAAIAVDVNATESSPVESQAVSLPDISVPSEREKWLKEGTPLRKADPEPATESSATEQVESDAPAPEADEPQEQKAEKKAGTRTDAAARVKELLAERKALQDRLEALERPKPQEEKPKEQPKVERPKMPEALDNETWADYKTRLDKYHEDLAEWKIETKLAEKDELTAKQQREEQAKTARDKSDEEMAAKVADTRKKHADFDQHVTKDIPVSEVMDHFFRNRALGAEVLYEVCKDPNKAREIASADPVTAAFELSKIELSILTVPEPQTTAKRPPANLSAKTTSPADPIRAAVEAGDTAAYIRLMNAKELASKRAS